MLEFLLRVGLGRGRGGLGRGRIFRCWQDWGCRGAAAMSRRPWVSQSNSHNGVFRGRLKHTHALRGIRQPTLFEHALRCNRCRVQRSTWGFKVEREGHWEMFLATCRASILRAASTSSSWAARMREGFGEGWRLGDGGSGEGIAAPKVERAERKTHRDLSGTETHTFALQYSITNSKLRGNLHRHSLKK